MVLNAKYNCSSHHINKLNHIVLCKFIKMRTVYIQNLNGQPFWKKNY